MLCPVCHGRRFIVVRGAQVPCPECQGFGELHCCDGLTEQADPVDAGQAPETPQTDTPPRDSSNPP